MVGTNMEDDADVFYDRLLASLGRPSGLKAGGGVEVENQGNVATPKVDANEDQKGTPNLSLSILPADEKHDQEVRESKTVPSRAPSSQGKPPHITLPSDEKMQDPRSAKPPSPLRKPLFEGKHAPSSTPKHDISSNTPRQTPQELEAQLRAKLLAAKRAKVQPSSKPAPAAPPIPPSHSPPPNAPRGPRGPRRSPSKLPPLSAPVIPVPNSVNATPVPAEKAIGRGSPIFTTFKLVDERGNADASPARNPTSASTIPVPPPHALPKPVRPSTKLRSPSLSLPAKPPPPSWSLRSPKSPPPSAPLPQNVSLQLHLPFPGVGLLDNTLTVSLSPLPINCPVGKVLDLFGCTNGLDYIRVAVDGRRLYRYEPTVGEDSSEDKDAEDKPKWRAEKLETLVAGCGETAGTVMVDCELGWDPEKEPIWAKNHDFGDLYDMGSKEREHDETMVGEDKDMDRMEMDEPEQLDGQQSWTQPQFPLPMFMPQLPLPMMNFDWSHPPDATQQFSTPSDWGPEFPYPTPGFQTQQDGMDYPQGPAENYTNNLSHLPVSPPLMPISMAMAPPTGPRQKRGNGDPMHQPSKKSKGKKLGPGPHSIVVNTSGPGKQRNRRGGKKRGGKGLKMANLAGGGMVGGSVNGGIQKRGPAFGIGGGLGGGLGAVKGGNVAPGREPGGGPGAIKGGSFLPGLPPTAAISPSRGMLIKGLAGSSSPSTAPPPAANVGGPVMSRKTS